MKLTIIGLLASLAVILTGSYLNLLPNRYSPVRPEKIPISQSEMKTVWQATIQIYLYPKDSLEALGVDQGGISLNEAMTNAVVEYRYERGLGTLVNHRGEILLITHNHWGCIDTLGIAQFRDAAGEPLLEMNGDTFKELIRYQDGGTMILGRPADRDSSDYLGAMVWDSHAKSKQRVQPVAFEPGENVRAGQDLIIVRQGRSGSTAVELIRASVQSVEDRWGQPVYKLQNADGENILPGDSGGGLWQGGRFIGNMWKSEYTYGWNWDTAALEKQWTETSYAASLPHYDYRPPQSLETTELVEDAGSIPGGQEY